MLFIGKDMLKVLEKRFDLKNYIGMFPGAGDSVKRIPPDTAIHEQNGYAKVYDDNNILMTIVDNDKSDTTHTDMRNK